MARMSAIGKRVFFRLVENPSCLRVLVVDDEPLIRWSLSETLSDRGHSVLQAKDGQTTLAALTADGPPIDVIVLDYRLPDSSDLNLLSTVRKAVPRAAVIMMTAHGTPEMFSGALKLGAFRVMSKPFEDSEMADLVWQAHNARGL